MTKSVKPKPKKIENDTSLSQQEFNQIYYKLKKSLEKSLEDYDMNEKIQKQNNRNKIKGKMIKQVELT